MTRRKLPRATFPCPNCGADVPSGARACRECGSDDRTGWQDSDEIDYQAVELPDSFDAAPARTGTPLWIAVTAALLVVVLVALLTFGLW